MKKNISKRCLLGFIVVLLMLVGITTASAVSPPVPEIPFTTFTIDTIGGSYAWEVPVSNKPLVKPKMDVVYVMDTTGSMSSYRSILANTVNTFNAKLEAAGATDIYWGAAFFGDMYCDIPWYGMQLTLGSYPLDRVSAEISALHSTGGGDGDEDACAAFMRAIAETPWREDAQHVVVLVTDAPTKYANYPDTAFATRSTTLYGGYPITAEGASALASDYNIQACLLTVGASWLPAMSAALGVTEKVWRTSAELQTALEVTVIAPYPDDIFYEAKIISSTYKSDGTVSCDVILDIEASPAEMLLEPSESGMFSFFAQGSTTPTRYCDTTVVEIGYFADGVRLDSVTQYLNYSVDALVTFLDWNEDILDTQLVACGSGAVAPDDPVREGYTFIGWDKDFSNVTDNMIVTAQYEINIYTVSFYKQSQDNNNKIAVAPYATQQVTYNELIDWTKISAGKNAVWYVTDGKTYGAKFDTKTPVTSELMLAVKDQNNNQQ